MARLIQRGSLSDPPPSNMNSTFSFLSTPPMQIRHGHYAAARVGVSFICKYIYFYFGEKLAIFVPTGFWTTAFRRLTLTTKRPFRCLAAGTLSCSNSVCCDHLGTLGLVCCWFAACFSLCGFFLLEITPRFLDAFSCPSNERLDNIVYIAMRSYLLYSNS